MRGRHLQPPVQADEGLHQLRAGNLVAIRRAGTTQRAGGGGIMRQSGIQRKLRDQWQHHRIRHAMWHMEKSTDRPAETMDQRSRCIGDGKPGMGCAQHHRFTRIPVIRIISHLLKICPNQLQRGKRQRFGMGIAVAVDQRLQRMGQRIDASIDGDAVRAAQRQLVIDDGGDRQSCGTEDQHFFARDRIGDDGGACHFRSGASGGGDSNHRHDGEIHDPRHLQCTQVFTAGRDDGACLCGIHGATTAEGDKTIMTTLGNALHQSSDRYVRGVLNDLGENGAVYAFAWKRLQKRIGMAELLHHGVTDEQRTINPERFQHGRQSEAAAAADQHFAGHQDTVYHCSSPPLSFCVVRNGRRPCGLKRNMVIPLRQT
ncbi:hypothetical protein AGR3A_Lc130173 [Agrobacterium tomkonis CFBP 6623]|uniref:Uncharacterized protein n=1 Tax=Agrobacterium tomkonis CFBP 6623 TaxID=1183432 RepID=A0A1S7R9F9_9HYPH|nr:hypothetical protein AGR3A_Lc130173 [Agrobacterium tomkonis CFBP 6623]